MRAVYDFCQDGASGPPPPELEGAFMVKQYGAGAVFGRTMRIREMRTLSAALSVWDAWHARARYRDKDGDKNYAEWAERNPAPNKILNEARYG